jgi:hypothetical protein
MESGSSGFSVGCDVELGMAKRSVHPVRRTTPRSLSKEKANQHYRAKCGLRRDYSQSRRPTDDRKRHKLEIRGRLDWRGSCYWN